MLQLVDTKIYSDKVVLNENIALDNGFVKKSPSWPNHKTLAKEGKQYHLCRMIH